MVNRTIFLILGVIDTLSFIWTCSLVNIA